MRSTSMSRSSAPVDVSGGRARRPRHHPHPRRVVGAGGAREKPARGAAERRAMHGRRQRRAAMQYTREPCKRGATRNARVASSRRTGHRRRQIHCVYLRWPAVAGVKRPIARQQAARAGRVEDGGVLGHARALEVHGADLVHNSSVSSASGRHTLSSVKPAPSVGCRCAGSAALALDRVRVQLHCRMWRHLVQCATSRPEDIIVHDCRRRKRLWINNHHSTPRYNFGVTSSLRAAGHPAGPPGERRV